LLTFSVTLGQLRRPTASETFVTGTAGISHSLGLLALEEFLDLNISNFSLLNIHKGITL
jgi:hypothetical protein